ncbi:MAG: hypothetical protein IPJ30_23635 [Acidobacteria bacterium]|nr:hypothetical protein [Acidobacteriota bacterium]
MKLKSFLLILIAAAAVQAQSPSKVLSRANKALGSEKVLKSVRSWQSSGTITRKSDGATGRYEAEASGGSLYGGMFDLNGFEYAVGYNGKSGWMRDSRNGLRTLTGEAAKDFQAEAVYRNSRWLSAKAEKTKISAGGTVNVSGRPASVVVLNSSKGVQMKLFFDQATGLLVREEIPQGPLVKSFDYSDYRIVSGIQTAFAIVSKIADETFEIKLDSVKYNEPVARAKFDFPRVSNEPIPDIPTLFAEIKANAERVDEILENYSYTELRIDREPLPNGELVEKSSEKRLLTFYKGLSHQSPDREERPTFVRFGSGERRPRRAEAGCRDRGPHRRQRAQGRKTARNGIRYRRNSERRGPTDHDRRSAEGIDPHESSPRALQEQRRHRLRLRAESGVQAAVADGKALRPLHRRGLGRYENEAGSPARRRSDEKRREFHRQSKARRIVHDRE